MLANAETRPALVSTFVAPIGCRKHSNGLRPSFSPCHVHAPPTWPMLRRFFSVGFNNNERGGKNLNQRLIACMIMRVQTFVVDSAMVATGLRSLAAFDPLVQIAAVGDDCVI